MQMILLPSLPRYSSRNTCKIIVSDMFGRQQISGGGSRVMVIVCPGQNKVEQKLTLCLARGIPAGSCLYCLRKHLGQSG